MPPRGRASSRWWSGRLERTGSAVQHGTARHEEKFGVSRPEARACRRSGLAQRVLGRGAVSTNEKMGRSTSTKPRKVEEPPPTPRRSLFFCCCGSAVDDIAHEVQLQVRAARAPPPLELQHGYANEENEKRGMAAPKFGTFEVTEPFEPCDPLICR